MGGETKQLRGVNDAPWLSKPHVHTKNMDKVIKKINCIMEGGRSKLQVIFDFDRTLTKNHENGVVTKSSYGVLENYPSVTPAFREASISLLAKYHPIETDPNLTIEEKIPFMVEWWSQGLEVLKGWIWDEKGLEEHLRQNRLPYRDGTTECFQRLYEAGVPVLVFSAGIGDVVKQCLALEGLLTSNVHLVSNFFRFEDGKIAGYVEDVIHVFNKNEQLVKNSPYYEELTGRSNVILLGDSLGDASMADGVSHDTVLKIGFLNTKIEESLPRYLEVFDIVLTDDQTMDILLKILTDTL